MKRKVRFSRCSHNFLDPTVFKNYLTILKCWPYHMRPFHNKFHTRSGFTVWIVYESICINKNKKINLWILPHLFVFCFRTFYCILFSKLITTYHDYTYMYLYKYINKIYKIYNINIPKTVLFNYLCKMQESNIGKIWTASPLS